jgi:hypothetical protein
VEKPSRSLLEILMHPILHGHAEKIINIHPRQHEGIGVQFRHYLYD